MPIERDAFYSMLGIARRAGALTLGTDGVLSAIASGGAAVVLLDAAASENTKKRANAASRHYFKADTLFLRSACSGEENQSKMVLVLLQS